MTENVTKCPQFFSSYFICYTKYTSHFNSKFSRPVVRYFLKNLTIRDPILQFVQMNLDLKVGRLKTLPFLPLRTNPLDHTHGWQDFTT